MLTCIILAAGYSQRFGSPKALALWPNGKTVLANMLDSILSSTVDEIIVVLGAHADVIQSHVFNHKRVRFVYNKDYNFGQISSVQTAINALTPQTESFFILPVDFPNIHAEIFDRLRKNFDPNMLGIIPTFKTRKGHPPLLRRELIPEILTLSFDQGLNTVLKNNQSRIQLHEVQDEGIVQTFNTQEEWLRIIEKQ